MISAAARRFLPQLLPHPPLPSNMAGVGGEWMDAAGNFSPSQRQRTGLFAALLNFCIAARRFEVEASSNVP